jgi:hypothetical protein
MTPAGFLDTINRAKRLTPGVRFQSALAAIPIQSTAFGQIASLSPALGAAKVLEDHRKLTTGAMFGDAIKPKIYDSAWIGLAAIGKQSLAPAMDEISRMTHLRVAAEPYTAAALGKVGAWANIKTPSSRELGKMFTGTGTLHQIIGASAVNTDLLKERANLGGMLSAKLSESWLTEAKKSRLDLIGGAGLGFDPSKLQEQMRGMIGAQFDSKQLASLYSDAGLTGLAAKPHALQSIIGQLLTIDQIIPKGLVGSWHLPDSLRDSMEATRRAWERHDELEQELEGTLQGRLIFLLDQFTYGRAILMMERLTTEGIKAMLDLLELTLVAPKALKLLRKIVVEAPHLRDEVRRDLLRGLDHVEERDYEAALPDLFVGLEGAFRDGADARAEIAKKLLRDPPNARAVIAKVGFPEDRSAFLCEVADKVNDARHGKSADRRLFSLLFLVAILCYYEEFTEEPAVEWLSRRLHAEVNRQRQRSED